MGCSQRVAQISVLPGRDFPVYQVQIGQLNNECEPDHVRDIFHMAVRTMSEGCRA